MLVVEFCYMIFQGVDEAREENIITRCIMINAQTDAIMNQRQPPLAGMI